MVKWKKLNGYIAHWEPITIITGTGHKISIRPKVELWVDLDRETDDGLPFFYYNIIGEYDGTFVDKNPMTNEEIEKMANKMALDKYWKTMEFDSHF